MAIAIIGLVAGLLFLFQRWLYQKLWNRSVTVNLKFQEETVRAGDYTVLAETVENRKWLPLSALKVKFQCSGELKFVADENSAVSDMYYRNDLFSLMPFRRVIRHHRIHCTGRGYFGIRGIDLVGADLFLTAEMLESRPGETWLHVLPALFETEELTAAVTMINGEMISRRHLTADPFAYRGIREYTPFDDAKTVNWKASAKTEELKVNLYDFTSVTTVAVYLNLEDRQIVSQADQVEKAISIGAYLTKAFLEAGHGVSLYANGRDCIHKGILRMEGNRDKGQFEHICKMLARIDLRLGTEPFDQCFEAGMMNQTDRMLVIISPDRHAEIQDLLCRLLSRGREFAWICPCRRAEEVEVRKELLGRSLPVPDRR